VEYECPTDSSEQLDFSEGDVVRDGDRQRVSPPDASSHPPRKGDGANQPVGPLAIGLGILATFLWTVFATLQSQGKPGAGVNLGISVLVGLIGTAIGGCVGWLIGYLRQ
jgi:hypothetical protein